MMDKNDFKIIEDILARQFDIAIKAASEDLQRKIDFLLTGSQHKLDVISADSHHNWDTIAKNQQTLNEKFARLEKANLEYRQARLEQGVKKVKEELGK